MHLITELKDATCSKVSEFVSQFNALTGCTWRIGKTAVSSMFKRSVHYECVHRAPTHTKVTFKVGERYMKRSEENIEYICVRIDIVQKSLLMFNKTTQKIVCVPESDDYFMIGRNRKSFGCQATLTVQQVFAGSAIIRINWAHNHDLDAFASTSRKDPAAFVKEWFASEYRKGVEPMKALRGYVGTIMSMNDIGDAVRVMADRFDSHNVILCNNIVNVESTCHLKGMF